ncbi:hypothetical protein [Fenollaria sporofastidiosus]|nr:hypothetical protein [Fenollaria sporofastidiosus]
MNKLSSLYDDKGILEIQTTKAEEFIKILLITPLIIELVIYTLNRMISIY